MEPAAQPSVQSVPVKKSSPVPFIALIAAALAILLAAVAAGLAVYLLIQNASLKMDISKLQGNLAIVASEKAKDIDELNDSLISLYDVDMAALKADIAALQQADTASAAPDFTVASFDLKQDSSEYYATYEGDGVLTCADKGPYLVLVKQTLLSGGAEYTKKEMFFYVVVNNGVGKFTTYDGGDPGKLARPDYKFEILGFVKADTLSD